MNTLVFSLTVLLQLCSSSGLMGPVRESSAHGTEAGLPRSEINSRFEPKETAPHSLEKQNPDYAAGKPLYEPLGTHGKSPLDEPPKPVPQTNRLQRYGVKLASKYFEEEYTRGFRWGYYKEEFRRGFELGQKLSKRIHSVARKCNKVLKSLCPQPTDLESSLLEYNSKFVKCIVEIANFGQSNETCLQSYERYVYPPEATCILDKPDTLTDKNCTDEYHM